MSGPDEQLLEALAAWSHQSWCGWARWMIDTYSIESVARWERQITTSYDDLTEDEKHSDRQQAYEIMKLL